MIGSFVRVVSTLLCAAALTGCGAPSEISRSAIVLQVPQPAALTALSLKFRAETPYVVNFGFDLDALDAEARGNLDVQADWILAHPNVKFRVFGHADKVGNPIYNIDIGLRRATNAVDYLVSKGIDIRRLEAMVSYGEEAPVIDTEDRERANRRTVTDVYAFIAPIKDDEGRELVVARVTIADSFTEPPETTEDPAQEPDPEPEQDDGNNPNSGRGNGDEEGDPGKSGGKNNGGDEL